MFEKLITTISIGFSFIVLDISDFHYMDHMMDWWGIPFMGFWWIGVWIIQFVLAFMVYKDAEKKGNNGPFWFILVIIPWVGFLFLISYIVIRDEKIETEEAIDNAQKLLDERYAKGEITRKEYLQIKKDMEEWR